MTLIKIESRYRSSPHPAFINPDAVQRVSFEERNGETTVRLWLQGDMLEVVSVEEWARIESLLTGDTPAPVATDMQQVAHDILDGIPELRRRQKALDDIYRGDGTQDELYSARKDINRAIDGLVYLTQQLAQSVASQTAPVAPSLPADVVTAYHAGNEADDASLKRAFFVLMGTLSHHIPTEEADHE